jgi:hypothetical protein
MEAFLFTFKWIHDKDVDRKNIITLTENAHLDITLYYTTGFEAIACLVKGD